MRPRPLPVTVAAVLLVILSLQFYGGIVLCVAGLVAAAGLWRLKRWGSRLTIVVCVLFLLSAAPGISFAPNAALRVAATATVLVSALIIVLVFLPASRRAFTAS